MRIHILSLDGGGRREEEEKHDAVSVKVKHDPMSWPRCMHRSTTARGTPMYGTRRMRWRANSRQMTRPSRRRSEETMNERASSCVSSK